MRRILMASHARSMSSEFARARAATWLFLMVSAISLTDSKSPSEAMGKPASMMSTPRASSCLATRSFSWPFIVLPGDCSPSLNVVSKISSLSCTVPSNYRGSRRPFHRQSRWNLPLSRQKPLESCQVPARPLSRSAFILRIPDDRSYVSAFVSHFSISRFRHFAVFPIPLAAEAARILSGSHSATFSVNCHTKNAPAIWSVSNLPIRPLVQ